MEFSWLIYALLSTLAIGLVAFVNKIFAKNNFDQKYSALILHFILFIFSGIYLSFFGISNLDLKTIILAIFFGLQIYSYSLIMMTVLRYLPTSTYFINVRLSSSFILLIIGMIFFKDIISRSETMGFIFGVTAMLLLFEKENKKNIDYKKGIIFLIFGIISLVVGHTIHKIISLQIENLPTILFITFLSGFIASIIFGYEKIKENQKHIKTIFKFNIVQGLLFFFYIITVTYMYNSGDLGTSYKILSYSPFIPIILSLIIYKEKITKKKFFGMIFTLLSIWFFI